MSITLSAEFGYRQKDKEAWVTIAKSETVKATFIWPGGPKEALAVAQQVNAIRLARSVLEAVRAECRDCDTDSVISSKVGEQVDEALLALGVKP